MMRCVGVIISVLAVFVSAVTPASAAADKWSARAIADTPTFTPLPDKAYVLIAADHLVPVMLMHLPDPVEATAYTAERAKALNKAHDRWVKASADYKAQVKASAGSPAPVNAGTPPVEPIDATFGYPTYEQSHSVSIGPQYRFSKAAMSVYLQEMIPGEYVLYGIVPLGGVSGVCACMGTVSFTTHAGMITVLGNLRFPQDEMILDWVKGNRPRASFVVPENITRLRLDPGFAGLTDPRLPADKLETAVLHPVARMPNWYGVAIDRLMPIDGVFRYERDRQIDLTGGAKSALRPANPQ